MKRPEAGETRPTLGELVNEVRWDYDPAQRLLSPLVPAAKYFEEFPWNGEPEELVPPGALPPVHSGRS
jgi:hypothetical protein